MKLFSKMLQHLPLFLVNDKNPNIFSDYHYMQLWLLNCGFPSLCRLETGSYCWKDKVAQNEKKITIFKVLLIQKNMANFEAFC